MSRRRQSVLAGTCALLALGGGALGAARTSGAGTVTITVTAGKPSELKFTLSKTQVPMGTVVFKVVNKGKKPHSFVIAGKTTKSIAPGKSATITVVFQKGGSFAYRSSLQGQAMMKGALKVTVATTAGTTTTAAPTCANPTATTVNVSLFEYGITMSPASIPCGTVTFVVTNTGTINHNLSVTGGGAGAVLTPGGSGSFTANLVTSGSFSYLCQQGNHAGQGMVGSLTVT